MAGVGTVIHTQLARIGINPHTGCNCQSLMREMDRVGPQYIKENLDLYASRMRESARQWSGIKKTPKFIEGLAQGMAKRMLLEAIKWCEESSS
jgi:hypothetical protein